MYAMRMAAFALGLMAAGTALAETPSTTTTTPSTPQQQTTPAQPAQPGMMGPGMGMGQGGMMGGQGMGRGMKHGMGMGMGPCGQQAAGEVTVDTVKAGMEAKLARTGNSHVKLGEVTKQADGTIVATIVTKKEGALVDKFVIDPKTHTRKRVD